MAGITTSTRNAFPFHPILSHSHSSKTTPFHSSLYANKFFALRLRISLSPSSSSAVISARYGGGGPRGRSRQTVPDDDSALDLSTVRSVNVRLIDENQNMVGIVSKSEAIQMAESAELDLVVLSPDADPPVVRIMDYNKYRYEQQKKKKDQQKKSAASRMDFKELKMGINAVEEIADSETAEENMAEEIGAEIKKTMMERKKEEKEGGELLSGVATEENTVEEIRAEIKKTMMERKKEEKGGELLSGVAEEIREIEWPVFRKVLGTTGVVLAVIAGSSVVLLTFNAVLAELSDRVFAGRGVQDFF